MNTTSFTFDFPYQIEVPLYGHIEYLYRVTVSAEPVYDYCTLSRADVFQGVDFHIEQIECVTNGIGILNAAARDFDSKKFYAEIKDAAQWHYEQRHCSTDFETVTIHDHVNGQDVTVYDNIQTV